MHQASRLVFSPRIISRSASTLSKETTRIDLRKKKRANCAVYGFGLSASGALAIPALVVQEQRVTSRETHKPLRISFCNLREIKKVSSGFGFSLFASRNKVYGAGLNNRFQIAGRVIDDVKGGREEYYISGRRVGGLPDGKIVDVASGRAHSLVIVDDTVYAFGCNVHGQCGVDPSSLDTVVANGETSLLNPVELPTSSKPVKVVATLDTSFVLTEDGKVYAFGLNEDGQCANGKYGIQSTPHAITGDAAGERIISLAGSTDTMMAVGADGRVFVWGQNEYGQAGKDYTDDIQLSISRALPSSSLPPVKEAVASATTCAAVTKDGAVYSWGVGVVGLGPDVIRLDHPTVLPQQLFDGRPVVHLHGGNVASAAINDEGNLFVWGQNRYGLLGLGHNRDQLFPFPLFFQEDVKQISIGPDHTIVVVK